MKLSVTVDVLTSFTLCSSTVTFDIKRFVLFGSKRLDVDGQQSRSTPPSAQWPGAGAAAATATAVAVAKATAAEAALSDALSAVKELEARCAQAQARQLEAVRQASSRVDELTRELEEANENGPKVPN